MEASSHNYRPRRRPIIDTAMASGYTAAVSSSHESFPPAPNVVSAEVDSAPGWSADVFDRMRRAGREEIWSTQGGGDASYLHDLLEAPVPNYPEEAVKKGWSGVGVFEIQFRPEGTAKDVVVVLTTGHELLDKTARASLLRWRCKPRAERNARMTMRFTTGERLIEVNGDDEEATKRGMNAAPRPLYPYEARRQGEGGFGVFVIRFNPDGSASKVVVLKSTGSMQLDNASILSFRRWRCRPGVYDTVLVPITYIPGSRRR